MSSNGCDSHSTKQSTSTRRFELIVNHPRSNGNEDVNEEDDDDITDENQEYEPLTPRYDLEGNTMTHHSSNNDKTKKQISTPGSYSMSSSSSCSSGDTGGITGSSHVKSTTSTTLRLPLPLPPPLSALPSPYNKQNNHHISSTNRSRNATTTGTETITSGSGSTCTTASETSRQQRQTQQTQLLQPYSFDDTGRASTYLQFFKKHSPSRIKHPSPYKLLWPLQPTAPVAASPEVNAATSETNPVTKPSSCSMTSSPIRHHSDQNKRTVQNYQRSRTCTVKEDDTEKDEEEDEQEGDEDDEDDLDDGSAWNELPTVAKQNGSNISGHGDAAHEGGYMEDANSTTSTACSKNGSRNSHNHDSYVPWIVELGMWVVQLLRSMVHYCQSVQSRRQQQRQRSQQNQSDLQLLLQQHQYKCQQLKQCCYGATVDHDEPQKYDRSNSTTTTPNYDFVLILQPQALYGFWYDLLDIRSEWIHPNLVQSMETQFMEYQAIAVLQQQQEENQKFLVEQDTDDDDDSMVPVLGRYSHNGSPIDHDDDDNKNDSPPPSSPQLHPNGSSTSGTDSTPSVDDLFMDYHDLEDDLIEMERGIAARMERLTPTRTP
jgi:hypothetical protein